MRALMSIVTLQKFISNTPYPQSRKQIRRTDLKISRDPLLLGENEKSVPVRMCGLMSNKFTKFQLDQRNPQGRVAISIFHSRSHSALWEKMKRAATRQRFTGQRRRQEAYVHV